MGKIYWSCCLNTTSVIVAEDCKNINKSDSKPDGFECFVDVTCVQQSILISCCTPQNHRRFSPFVIVDGCSPAVAAGISRGWGNESLAGHLHRGCHNIHGDGPSGWRWHAKRDCAGRNAGSGCERRDAGCACALRRRAGGICRTWNSAWSRAWLGARGGFRTAVDGQSQNRRRFYGDKIGGLGPS